MKRSPAASPIHAASTRGRALRQPVGLTFLALAILAGTGCYHASGVKRTPLVAEEIPAVSGDRVDGFKAAAAPGDLYLGNDFLQLAVNGSSFAASGGAQQAALAGSILDIGNVELDQNYVRVSTPADRLERMTPVVNQDPDLRVVIDASKPVNTESRSALAMSGRVYDPKHKLTGNGWDTADCVSGLTVSHNISLGKLDRYFLVSTTVTNNGANAVPVYNIGDHVHQVGGGFRLNVPASQDLKGNLIHNWGVDIPATGPGTTFGDPYDAVQASMVGLMGSEPSANLDFHASIGILPLTDDQLVVTSSPQPVFSEPRPTCATDIVAGGLPPKTPTLLSPGQSISYWRRIYLIAGSSNSISKSYYSQTTGAAAQASGLFNSMALDRYFINGWDFGTAYFYVEGSAVKAGPLQTEIRLERYIGTIDPVADPDGYAHDNDPTHWQLERCDWLEPEDNPSQNPSNLGVLLPSMISYASSLANPPLKPQTTCFYRVAFRNRLNPLPSAPPWLYVNANSTDGPFLPVPMRIETAKIFYPDKSSHLMAGTEHDQTVVGDQTVSYLFEAISVAARTANPPDGASAWQPYRVMVVGDQGTPDPNVPRQRTLGGVFSTITRQKALAGTSAGRYQFVAGNQGFGADISNSFMVLPGNYKVFGSRGPLASANQVDVEVKVGGGARTQTFVVNRELPPKGWATFDIPGPSQVTTGGFLPAEKLSSALAEGVQLVGNTELDLVADAAYLYYEFQSEFMFSGSISSQRWVTQNEPFVIGARSSNLAGYGTATALFTPDPRNERRGGARDSSNWTLADFITQAEGQFNVLNRPRGPEGLFTQKAFDPTQPLPAWWQTPGAFSLGKKQGDFDALELLNASSWDPSHPDAWFSEFQALRKDWFSILNQQAPTSFTKALGLSSAVYSVDTSVGMARTYVKAQSLALDNLTGFYQGDLSKVQTALNKGALVASTGPLVDATLSANGKSAGPGELLDGPNASVTLTVKLFAAQDWVPVDELRVVINGVTTVLDINELQPLPVDDANYDWRLRQGTFVLNLPATKDAWVVVEAGVPLGTTGAYLPGTAWDKIMHGIYPVAVSNPIFVSVLKSGSYTPPGL